MFNKGIYNKHIMDRFDDNQENVEAIEEEMFGKADAGEGTATAQEKAPAKSPEVVRLETELDALRTRCTAAETKLSEVQTRFQEAKNGLEKETAEMRERLKKSLSQQANEKQASFLMSLLPVLDNLNRAVEAGESDASFDNLIVGVKGTARSFEQALASVGVEAVESIGADFNPEIHEAVEMVASSPENDGKIVGEFAKGYKFGERLLRPARVQVGKGQ